MIGARESWLELDRGRFRALSWGNPAGEPVLFLHGLTAVAEVWGPTVSHLGPERHYVAIDQRGHGDSPRGGTYAIGEFVADTVEAIRSIGVPLHLVGHSMGARVAIVTAARYPELLRSVAIVDIGVEASAANIRETVQALSNMPASFASEEEAFAFAFRNRQPDDAARAIFRARLKDVNGGLVWRGSVEGMIETVKAHRRRNYWADWRNLRVPALFIHGGRSNELSVSVADRMRAENPGVRYELFEGIPHNVPLIAAERLAGRLEEFWTNEVGGE